MPTEPDTADAILRELAAASWGNRPLARGEVVADRFVIERLAGAGGMGTVYRAIDRVTVNRVALKLMQSNVAARERFAQEVHVLAELAHPAVVRHVAHGPLGAERMFLAMEWLEGEDLAHRLERGPLSVADAVAIVQHAAQGLAHAHARGVVHRDVKPSNLFLVGGDPAQVKVLDFGVARLATRARAMTKTGAIVGTVGYMAPEQAIGEREIDASADVFSLGCVLFESLSGQPAFAADHAVAILAKVLHEEAPRVSSVRDVPAGLDDLVSRMLAKDRAERPNASDLFSALEQIDPRGSAAPASRSLIGREQRLVCVILADVARELDELAAGFGADSARLADGTALLTHVAPGEPTDHAARMASLALALRDRNPSARVALAMGRAETTGRHPVGPAIDRAAALLDGVPGEIRIDDVAASLLDTRFEIRGRVLAARRDAEEARTLLGKPTPCVGRDKELSLLDATLAECISDRVARAVLVTAPPGAGKSRLRREFMRRARTDAWFASADPVGAGSPLGLVRQLVRGAARVREGDTLAAQYAGIRERLSRHFDGDDLVRVSGFLGELVGASPASPSPALLAARSDPATMGARLRQSFEEWVASECASAPLVILLEDLHWGDAASIAYIDAVLRRCADRPLLVVALGRPDVHELFPRLWHGLGTQEIRLGALTRRAAERLVRAVLGDDAEPATVALLVDRAEGNAYYLEELIRRVAEDGSGTLPETILAMLESRLDRLETEARRVLRAASVFGEVCWRGAVLELLGGDARADEWLLTLVDRELLTARGGARFSGETEYAFRHGLLRDACYAMLVDTDRAEAHRLAGDWLERAGEKDALVLADHFERGGEPARAVPALVGAAELALRAGKPQEVLALVERGLAAGATGLAIGTLRMLECRAHGGLGRWVPAFESATEAMANLPRDSAGWFAAAATSLWGATVLGRAGELEDLTRELARAELAPDASGPNGYTLYTLMSGAIYSGQRELTFDFLRRFEAVESHSARMDLEFSGWLRTAQAFVAFNMEDDPGRAFDISRKAEAIFRETSQRGVISIQNLHALILLASGCHVDAERYLAEHIPFWEHEVQHLFESGLVLRARALSSIGRVAEARGISAAFPSFTTVFGRALAAVTNAHVELAAGELAAAERAAREALELAEILPIVQCQALALLARVSLDREAWQDVLGYAEQFHPLNRRAGEPTAESWVRCTEAAALHALGRGDEARAMITNARDRILRVAAGYQDTSTRESYVSNVEPNVRTLELAREWLGP